MSIEITPQNPSSDDNLVFVFKYPENNCSAISKTVVGSDFYYVQAFSADTPCLGSPVPYTASWNIGRLEAGNFQVTLTDKYNGSQTQSFSVAQGILPPVVSTPVIPTFGVSGATILIVGLAWIAHKMLKKTSKPTV